MDLITICILIISFLLIISLLDEPLSKFCSKYPITYYSFCVLIAITTFLFQKYTDDHEFWNIKIYIILTALFAYLFIPKSDGEYGSDFSFSITKSFFSIFTDYDIEHNVFLYTACKFIDTVGCISLFYALGMAFNWDLALLLMQLFVCILFAIIIKRK